jgi:phosphonoacetate hydrolase
MMDGYLAQLDALGCVIALTADHGMNAKVGWTARPTSSTCRTGSTPGWARRPTSATPVILPITDPYVVHHGALGSFATVYLPNGATYLRPALACRRSAASRSC